MKQIAGMIQLKDDGILQVKDLEDRIPNPIFQMYETVSKIVIENGIVKKEEEKARDKIEFAVKTAMNLQSALMTQNMKNQWNIKAFLGTLKTDIEAAFGSALS